MKDLKPHPQNYREHEDDQLEHIKQSIRANGFYRNVVAAKDHTILAGHGVVEAAEQLGLPTVPTVVLPVAPDSAEALKILVGDNEIAKLGMVSDRTLTELLKEIKDTDDLLGTGYTDDMLAALVFVSRPSQEISDFDAAAEWTDMPEYEREVPIYRLIVLCESEESRAKFIKKIGAGDAVKYGTGKTISIQYPFKEVLDDMVSVRFEPS